VSIGCWNDLFWGNQVWLPAAQGGGGTTISGTWAMYHIKKLTFTAVNVNRPVGQYLQQGETENLEDLPNRH